MQQTSIIALDVGEKRIGIARADAGTRFPSPLTTIDNDKSVWSALTEIINADRVITIVVGLPRNLNGDDTAQTEYTRDFIRQLTEHTDLPIITQDEALTSIKAKEELENRKKDYQKGDVDALAATYILEDYLIGNRE